MTVIVGSATGSNFNSGMEWIINLPRSIVNATPTEYTVHDVFPGESPYFQVSFTGSGFTYNAGGMISGGTVTGISLEALPGYIEQWTVTASDFSFSGAELAAVFAARKLQALFDLLGAITFTGGTGGDVLSGSSLNDTFTGGDGDDSFSGQGGNDTMDGGAGADGLNGGDGDDHLFGGSGGDRFFAGAGNDILESGSSSMNSDWLQGDRGDDTYIVSSPAARVSELHGNGFDTIIFREHGYLAGSYPIYGRFEKIIFETDQRSGGDFNNEVQREADMTAIAGRGSVSLVFGDGNDLFRGGPSADFVWGQEGNDTLYGAGGDDELYAGPGIGKLYGQSGNDKLGLQYAALLTKDSIWIGGEGDDTYLLPHGNRIIERAGGGVDTIVTDRTISLPGNFENLILAHRVAIDGTGNAADNVITGNGSSNILKGLAGNDTIDGSGGEDTLYGGVGNDHLIGGKGGDSLFGAEGNDLLEGGDDVNFLYGGAGRDVLIGGTDVNFLQGGAGADILRGGGIPNYPDYAEYSDSPKGLTVSLHDPSLNTGYARGDSFESIEGIVGSDFDDHLTGDGGMNFFVGGRGADTLAGGKGVDYFSFDHLDMGTGVDHVKDFGPDDLILVLGLPANTANFVGALNPTDLGGPAIVYVPKSGELMFDEGGEGGGKRHVIAVLDNHFDLAYIQLILA